MAQRGRPPKPLTRPKRPYGRGSIVELVVDEKHKLVLPASLGRKEVIFNGTWADASAELDRLIDNPAPVTRWTLGDFAKGPFATNHAMTTTAKTHSDLMGRVETNIVDKKIGKLWLDQCGPEHVDDWMLMWVGKSANTIKRYRGDLSQIFRFAVESGLMPRNPVSPKRHRLADDKIGEGRPTAFLTAEQLPPFIAHCHNRGDLWANRFIVSVLCGLRPSEACALRWSDIDLDAGRVTIRAAVKRDSGGKPIGLGKTKNKKERHFSLANDARIALKRQAELNEAPGYRKAAIKPWHSDTIFLGPDGRPFNRSTIHSALVDMCADAKLPPVAPYDLRRTCVSWLYKHRHELDIDIVDIARMIGDTVEVVIEHYLKFDKDDLFVDVGPGFDEYLYR